MFATDGTRSLTFRELFDAGQRLAVGLHRRGLRRGDTAAVQLPNWVEFIQVLTALSRLGVIMVPIMPIYRRDDVSYVLANAGVRAVFTPSNFGKFDYLDMYLGLRKEHPELTLVVTRPDSTAEEVADTDAEVFTLQQLEADTDDESARPELEARPSGSAVRHRLHLGNHLAAERVRAHVQHILCGITRAGRAIRLHRDRCPVRPLPDSPHHRAGNQRVAAHADRGVDTRHGQVGPGPRH